MSDDTPYSKREIDKTHDALFEILNRIEKQTTLTNGKVRRLYIYLTATASFAVGLGLVEAKAVLTFLM